MAERAAAEERGEGCFFCAHCPSVLFQMVFPERLAVSCPEVRPLPLALVSLLIAEGKREVFPRKNFRSLSKTSTASSLEGKPLENDRRSPLRNCEGRKAGNQRSWLVHVCGHFI